MLNFEEWYEINPFKDKIDKLNLPEKDKKKLTPVIVNSSFILDCKPFYNEFASRFRKQIVPDFAVKQFALNYKGRLLTAIPFYELEKELNYLISKVPEAISLEVNVSRTSKFNDVLKEAKWFEFSLERGFDERVKILHNGRLYGWKFKEERP